MSERLYFLVVVFGTSKYFCITYYFVQYLINLLHVTPTFKCRSAFPCMQCLSFLFFGNTADYSACRTTCFAARICQMLWMCWCLARLFALTSTTQCNRPSISLIKNTSLCVTSKLMWLRCEESIGWSTLRSQRNRWEIKRGASTWRPLDWKLRTSMLCTIALWACLKLPARNTASKTTEESQI